MYEPTGFALDIFRSRHAAHENETWAEASDRVAVHVSNAEIGDKRAIWRNKFYDVLVNNLLMPGGRIWYGAGRAKGQMLNCVSGDTLVHTRDGLVPARNLVGKVVDTLSDGGVYRPAKWDSYGVQELYRVEFENGDVIEATEGHQWVITGSTPGRRVTTRELEGRNIPMQHLAASERVLNEQEYRAGVQHGLVYGDGTIHESGKAVLLQFGDSRHLIADHFDEYSVQYHARYPDGVYYVGKLDPRLKTELPSVKVHGHSYVFGFLAGYIAADGNVDSRGSVSLHCNSRETLEAVRLLAAEVGVTSTSITLARELSPFNGELAPLYCLRFAKSAIEPRLILKNKHRDYMANAPKSRTTTVKVVSVRATGRMETVYCCEEPETHTWVAGPGYLTGNCFVIPTEDSREGWGKTVYDMIVISGTGGGVGCNFSPTRPRGSKISGTGGEATGSVSLMEVVNAAGEVIKAGGGRRTALMFCLSLSHGDIIEFLDKKLDLDQLNNANVSVVFDEDPDTFFDAVRNDAMWPLYHNSRKVGEVPAKDLWNRIVENALKNGEPGTLNGYLANKMSNIWYIEKLTSTNPCGEIWMSPYDCCCLGALVLPRFVTQGKNGPELDWDLLRSTVHTGVRFLDDVLTVNNYPLPEIAAKCSQLRRIGLGVTGLHHMLLELNLQYNSPAGLEFVDKVMNFIKNEAYWASSELAKEKGPFPAFDAEKYLKGNFVKTLKPSLRKKIERDGMRNCATMTIAPVGTGSIVCNTSSGIEPIFAPAFIRRYQTGTQVDGTKIFGTEELVDPMFQRFVDEGRDITHFVGAHDLTIRDHLEMQRVCQRHVDNAVSKTINIPANTTLDQLSEVYMEYLPDLKGVTIYPEGSRENQPLTPLSRERALELALAAKSDTQVSGADSCRNGVCDL